MPYPQSLEDLREIVESQGGIQSFSMDVVRDAYGAGRLGIHVRTNISKALQGIGLGHYPTNLPDSQHQLIRIYKLGSPVADLIDAVLRPGGAFDARIRELVSGNADADAVLAQVRELVCP